MKYFIEIGSNNFDTLLPLAENDWSGVIVEPIEKYLNTLPKLDNVKYINAAVTDNDVPAMMSVYNEDVCIKDSDFRGMSTLETHGVVEVNAHLIHKELVNCITYDRLTSEYCADFTQLDFLKIDTEGHDLKILQAVDFNSVLRPLIIKIEHKHCDGLQITDLLKSNGYFVMPERYDIYAISFK
jgi:FkbM family methyltransferase